MSLKRALCVLLCLFCALPAMAGASTINFTAILSGSSEVPPTGSSGSGMATFSLDGNLLTVDLFYSGLSSNSVAAHIHCCAAPGTNAPVVLPFVGLPTGTSGTYTHTFDLTTALVGISESAFLTSLEDGMTYTNVHTLTIPSGEIRGQIEVAATPEPASLLLLATGVLGMAALVGRRARGVAGKESR